jgi:DNA gyrase subunit A
VAASGSPDDPAGIPTPTDVPSDRREARTIEQEMRQSFLDYAMSVIVSRALPDARDGLKPVHRRIMYAMGELGMGHTQGYKKSAYVVGEVLGKYHPHGDSSVYDAMVRMAQQWSLRYPLVDGQGNFGSVDGDSAAAMRYTEAKLAKISSQMLGDIDKDTVDWDPNYDGRLKEPHVLPAAIPNLLINGADGIAVGMATKVAPHNLTEVLNAVMHLIANPEAQVVDLMEFVSGPDFPTGGIIYGRSGIRQAYATGKGRIIVRGLHHIEPMGNDKERIVFEELPYQVNKANLLMHIADLAKDKVIEGISDLRDESDRRGMRMVIELKKDAITDVILNQLWKHTPLQSSYSINNLALVNGLPRTLDLKTMLQVFIDHRFDVVTRRTQYELSKAQARAHLLEGLIFGLDYIEEIVELIKRSNDANEARAFLQGATPLPASVRKLLEGREGLPDVAGIGDNYTPFALSDLQAKAILEMRLQKLTGLESEALRTEHAELMERIAYYTGVLADAQLVYGIIQEELAKVLADFGDERRTRIEDGEIDIEDEDLIPEETSVFTFTKDGYLKRMPLDTYKEQNRGGKGLMGMKSKEDDHVLGTTVGSTHDWLCFFTNTGRIHWLKGYRVPAGSRQSRGKPVQNLINLDDGEKIENIIPVRNFEVDGEFLFFATKNGLVKKTPLSAYKNIRQVGIKAIELRDGDELLAVRKTDGNQDIILATSNGQACRFDEDEVRSMGRVAAGVRGIKLAPGASVVAIAIAELGVELLTVTRNGYGKRTVLEEYRKTHRGGKGVRTIIVNERNGDVCALRTVEGDESLLVISKEGMVVRTPVSQVSQQGRSTQGVRVVRVSDGDVVTQVAVLRIEDDDAGDDSAPADDPAAASGDSPPGAPAPIDNATEPDGSEEE